MKFQNEYNKPMDVKDYFINEFRHRKSSNRTYSMRAFARDLGLTPQHLSYIVRGQSGISYEKAQKIIDKFNINKDAQKKFLLKVSSSFDRSPLARKFADDTLKNAVHFDNEQILAKEKLNLISEWYYLPILLIFDIKENADIVFISQKIGLSQSTVRNVLNKLVRAGLLAKNGTMYKKTSTHQALHDDKNNTYIKKLYLEMLKLSTKTIDMDEKSRSFSCILSTISKDEISFAVDQINDFRKKLGRQISERAKNPDRVYALSVQFFPVTKGL